MLTHQAYDEIRGVKKAIANHAEQIYQQLNQTQKKQAQRIFLQLIRPGEGTEDTRRLATRAEVGEENWELVSYLAGYTARLVVTGNDNKSGEDTVEVVHEALIREWLTLRKWINGDRQFRIWQERLKLAIHEWNTNNHDGGGLLRGVPLTVAEDWLQKRSDELTATERNFIQASIAKRDRQRRGIRAAITLGILTSTATMLSFFLLWQESQKQSILSILATIQTSKVLLSSNQQLEAMVEAVKAQKQFKTFLLGRADDLSHEFLRNFQQIVYEIQEYNRLENHTDDVLNISFSPDGKIIAIANKNGTINLWDFNTKTNKIIIAHNQNIWDVSFSADGKTIATASSDATAKLWNINGQLLQTFKGHSSSVYSVSFSPDGKLIATGSADGNAKLWNINGQLLQTFKGHSSEVFSVSFSPDGKMIATASKDQTTKFWNLKGQEIQTFRGHTNTVLSVNFSPDNKKIITASQDGTVIIWKLDVDIGQLGIVSCQWLKDYLKSNQNVEAKTRNLCQ